MNPLLDSSLFMPHGARDVAFAELARFLQVPSNRHKTSARGHRCGVASGKRVSQTARIAQESHAQPGEEQEGRR